MLLPLFLTFDKRNVAVDRRPLSAESHHPAAAILPQDNRFARAFPNSLSGNACGYSFRQVQIRSGLVRGLYLSQTQRLFPFLKNLIGAGSGSKRERAVETGDLTIAGLSALNFNHGCKLFHIK